MMGRLVMAFILFKMREGPAGRRSRIRPLRRPGRPGTSTSRFRFQRHIGKPFYRLSSWSSSSTMENTSSTGTPKWRASLRAVRTEELNFPSSMALIVWRLTPIAEARSSWVMFLMALKTRRLLRRIIFLSY